MRIWWLVCAKEGCHGTIRSFFFAKMHCYDLHLCLRYSCQCNWWILLHKRKSNYRGYEDVYNGRLRLLWIHFLATTVPCRLSKANGDQCSPRLPRYVRLSRLHTLGVKELSVAWQGHFQDKDGVKNVILEAIAGQSMWIWHAFFWDPRREQWH